MSWKIRGLLLATLLTAVEPANILGFFTSNSPSHQINHMSYVRALIERGHNVTVVTTTPLRDKNPRYHHILIPQTEARTKLITEQFKSMKDLNTKTLWQNFKFAAGSLKALGPVQYDAIKSQQFQDLMQNPANKFDLILLGYFFNDYTFGLGEHFKCPIIISGTSFSNEFLDRLTGNPFEMSYVPSVLAMSKADPMTFMGRLEYFYGRVVSRIFLFTMDRQFAEFYTDLFPPSKYPPIEEAAKRVSLVLLNTHFTDNIVRPNVPGVIEVGGIQIKEKPDPLPEDLQRIIKSSKDGVIYLSFGSNLGSKDLGLDTIQNLYKVLSNLNKTVIWKWDESEKPGNSTNIHFLKWIPQDDLLAQKNIKLFITHAGKGSVTESQFFGVPMLAIPIFADQPRIAKTLSDAGFGLELDRKTMTEDSIRKAVLEILENPKYTETVRRFSKLFRDRPMTAKQTAMFWIEYVLRHKGAYHMQSPAVHMNAFQYMSLDVIGFLLLVAYFLYKLIRLMITFLLRIIRSIILRSRNEVKLKQK